MTIGAMMIGRRRMATVALAAFAAAGGYAQGQAAAPQSGATSLRLYVLDCGTLIYNNPETYNLTRQEVKNTNMSVACYLVVHPRGALLFDTGLPDEALGRPFNESPM